MSAKTSDRGSTRERSGRLVAVNGVQQWLCPNCGAKLAEIVGERVVIRIRDRTISLRVDLYPDQVCWRCGETSVLAGGTSDEP